jgi:hypothetical protein
MAHKLSREGYRYRCDRERFSLVIVIIRACHEVKLRRCIVTALAASSSCELLSIRNMCQS